MSADVVTELRFIERDGKRILQQMKRNLGGGGDAGVYTCRSVFDKWEDVPLVTESKVQPMEGK